MLYPTKGNDMTKAVLLVLGGVNDTQRAPLVRAMADAGLTPSVVKLGARFAIEGTPSHKAMTERYGKTNKADGNAIIAAQDRQLQGCIAAVVGTKDYKIVAAVFGVERDRQTDEWNWVESLLSKETPLYWLEMCADGSYQLNSSDGQFGTALPIHAA